MNMFTVMPIKYCNYQSLIYEYNVGIPINRIESIMKVERLLFPKNIYTRWTIDTVDKYLMYIYEHMLKRLIKYLDNARVDQLSEDELESFMPWGIMQAHVFVK